MLTTIGLNLHDACSIAMEDQLTTGCTEGVGSAASLALLFQCLLEL